MKCNVSIESNYFPIENQIPKARTIDIESLSYDNFHLIFFGIFDYGSIASWNLLLT